MKLGGRTDPDLWKRMLANNVERGMKTAICFCPTLADSCLTKELLQTSRRGFIICLTDKRPSPGLNLG